MYGNRIKRRGGFTLTELMVVIGLIVVLMAILIPTVGTMRKRAYQTRTVAMIQKISSACQQYFNDFQAYPGIIDDGQLFPEINNPPQNFATKVGNPGGKALKNGSQSPDPTDPITYVTSSENLALSLLGGLTISAQGEFIFDKRLMRGGNVQNLNQLNPKTYGSYIDFNANEMSPGQFYNTFASDSVIPEFVDSFPDPMPIIYIRARPGAAQISSSSLQGPGQYDEGFLQPYWRQGVPGAGGTVSYTMFPTYDKPGVTSQPPVYNAAVEVFTSSSVAGQARGKDTFLLIAAGASRQYGTRDMIFSGN